MLNLKQWIEEQKAKWEEINNDSEIQEKYDVLGRLRQIESQLNQIESWKNNFADPQIRENIQELQKVLDEIYQAKLELKKYTDSQIENAKDTLNQIISDKISNAKSELNVIIDEDIAVAKQNLTNYINSQLSEVKTDLDAQIDNAKSNLKAYTDNLVNDTKAQFNLIIDDLEAVANRAEAKANNALSDAQTAFDKAQTALDQIPIAVQNAKNELTAYTDTQIANAKSTLQNYTNTLVANVENIAQQAKTTANSAISQAETAYNKALGLVEKIKAAGTQLQTDVTNLANAGDVLVGSIATEINTIRTQFYAFGQNIKDEVDNLIDGITYIKNEMNEAFDQISYPADLVNTYALRCRDHPIIFLPHNAFMTIYWGFLRGLFSL